VDAGAADGDLGLDEGVAGLFLALGQQMDVGGARLQRVAVGVVEDDVVGGFAGGLHAGAGVFVEGDEVVDRGGAGGEFGFAAGHLRAANLEIGEVVPEVGDAVAAEQGAVGVRDGHTVLDVQGGIGERLGDETVLDGDAAAVGDRDRLIGRPGGGEVIEDDVGRLLHRDGVAGLDFAGAALPGAFAELRFVAGADPEVAHDDVVGAKEAQAGVAERDAAAGRSGAVEGEVGFLDVEVAAQRNRPGHGKLDDARTLLVDGPAQAAGAAVVLEGGDLQHAAAATAAGVCAETLGAGEGEFVGATADGFGRREETILGGFGGVGGRERGDQEEGGEEEGREGEHERKRRREGGEGGTLRLWDGVTLRRGK
jgi:hypothetical protein